MMGCNCNSFKDDEVMMVSLRGSIHLGVYVGGIHSNLSQGHLGHLMSLGM